MGFDGCSSTFSFARRSLPPPPTLPPPFLCSDWLLAQPIAFEQEEGSGRRASPLSGRSFLKGQERVGRAGITRTLQVGQGLQTGGPWAKSVPYVSLKNFKSISGTAKSGYFTSILFVCLFLGGVSLETSKMAILSLCSHVVTIDPS